MQISSAKYLSRVIDYSFHYNGMESDPEVSGNGNSYTTQFRQYDPRLGRWKSLDPLASLFPNESPFVSFGNNPVFYIDPDGLKKKKNEESTPDKKKDKNLADANPNAWNLENDGSNVDFIKNKQGHTIVFVYTKNGWQHKSTIFGTIEVITTPSKKNRSARLTGRMQKGSQQAKMNILNRGVPNHQNRNDSLVENTYSEDWTEEDQKAWEEFNKILGGSKTTHYETESATSETEEERKQLFKDWLDANNNASAASRRDLMMWLQLFKAMESITGGGGGGLGIDPGLVPATINKDMWIGTGEYFEGDNFIEYKSNVSMQYIDTIYVNVLTGETKTERVYIVTEFCDTVPVNK